jgi:hypothetical protein
VENLSSSDRETFSVTGIECVAGYSEDNLGARATACGVDGDPYALSGCGAGCVNQEYCTQHTGNCLSHPNHLKLGCSTTSPGYYINDRHLVEECQSVEYASSITCSDGNVSDVLTCNTGYYKVDNSSSSSSSDECKACPGNTTVNTNDNTMCDNTCYQWNEETGNSCGSSQQLKSDARDILGGSVSECCSDVMCIDDIDCNSPENTISNQILRTGVCSAKTDTSRIEAQACSEANTRDDRGLCESIMKEGSTLAACEYTPVEDMSIGSDVYRTCCRDNTCADWDDGGNECNAANNRYYCSEIKGGETDPSETTCCISEGCPCNLLDDEVCDSGYIFGSGNYDPNRDIEEIKTTCCEHSDSISTDIVLSLTCEQINTFCDGDSTNDGTFFEEIAEILTGGNGVISQTDGSFNCGADIPPECSSCLNRECSAGKVLALFPSCTGGTTASPLCLDSDCCTDGQTCSSYDCSGSDGSLDPNPETITCAGNTCSEAECCTVSRFENMEGFQNNYQEVSMGSTYLIEGVENQQRFNIPVTIRLEPKDDTVKLSKRDITRMIDSGSRTPTLGITIDKSTTRRSDIRKVDQKNKDKWKIIALLIGIGIAVIFTLVVIISYKKRNPLLDLLS